MDIFASLPLKTEKGAPSVKRAESVADREPHHDPAEKDGDAPRQEDREAERRLKDKTSGKGDNIDILA